MARKHRLIGISVVAAFLVVSGTLCIYALYHGRKHRAVFGQKGRITNKEASKVKRFKERVLLCRTAVFLHKDIPYKAKKIASNDGWQKATEALVMGLNTCLVGQRSADGKGYSGKMHPKYLDALLAHKDCQTFADRLMTFRRCQFLFEELPDHAGFDDGLGDAGETYGKLAGMQ